MARENDRKISRRTFIQSSLKAGAALAAPLVVGLPARGSAVGPREGPPKVLLVSIDSLDPRYLYLDRNGHHGGEPGNWLMPHVRAFLEESTWFEQARCNMPSATDMNHVNAVAGTDVSEHGINMVSMQLFDWKANGEPNIVAPSLSYARDSQGRRVDTLFAAWKRSYPHSRTFYASGKEWVSNIFKVPRSGVDIFVGGEGHPWYVSEVPRGYKFFDPPEDANARRDSESFSQTLLNTWITGRFPDHFPPDRWVVDAALETLRRERPDFGVVLLAQMDDLQHVLGSAVEPDEFRTCRVPGTGDEDVSQYNRRVYRGAVLDGVRDVDAQFGRLIREIRGIRGYEDTLFVLYSDHGHITHRQVDTLHEMFTKSVTDTTEVARNTNLMAVLHRAGLLSRQEMNFIGFMPLMACSAGALHWKGRTYMERYVKARRAKAALLRHRVWGRTTGRLECPWWVMDVDDMRDGLPGVARAGELFHEQFAYNNRRGTLHWPDLILFMKNHWQLPTIAGLAANLGVNLPEAVTRFLAPVNLFLGGHGSVDTQNIVMAFSGPGVTAGRIVQDRDNERDYRISDIGVTLSHWLNLPLESGNIGRDLSSELT